MRLLPILLLAAGTAAAAELPVTAVTLSNAGLAEIERRGELAPDATLGFRVPLEAVDDVLKTLLLRDPAGTVGALRLPAQDLEAEAFRGLPVKPADFASRVALLRALRGQAVEAGGATGRLADAEESAGGLRVTLVTEAGLRLLQLREGDGVALRDAGLAARLARAAEALAASRSADERQVEITLSGATAPRPVSITYVAGAPVWKPSWRLILPTGEGEAKLQGWAVVENRSGADWDGVRLSLVSGNPAAYRHPLYAPIRVTRPELSVRVAEQVAVTADTGARPRPAPPPSPASSEAVIRQLRAAASESGQRGAMLVAPRAAAAAPAPAPDLPEPDAAADDLAALPPALPVASPGRIAYVLPAPVTLRAGETANLPFLEASLPFERLWWVQDLGARHPLNAAWLRNATEATLPDGLAAVFGPPGGSDGGGGGYLGDAELRAMGPGETRIVAFARDRDVLLSSAEGRSERPAAVAQRRDAMLVEMVLREEIALAVDPKGARGWLVLDLPRRPGATPVFSVAAEGDFGLRHEAMLTGEQTTLRLAWERKRQRLVPLWEPGLGEPRQLAWRSLDLDDEELRQLPGGPGALERFAEVLRALPEGAPGRAGLERTIELLRDTRARLDAARGAIRAATVATAALDRARAAAEDRTGAAREEARRRLNEASVAAERAGAAADAAWEAWGRSVDALLARPQG